MYRSLSHYPLRNVVFSPSLRLLSGQRKEWMERRAGGEHRGGGSEAVLDVEKGTGGAE